MVLLDVQDPNTIDDDESLITEAVHFCHNNKRIYRHQNTMSKTAVRICELKNKSRHKDKTKNYASKSIATQNMAKNLERNRRDE